MTDEGNGRTHDPRVLRAIAHPVRNRILTELSATGPMRAADVARVLGVPANQASFHLRQLAKYGLIEEAPEEARDQRDRVWRVTRETFSVNVGDMEAQPGGKAAARVFMRQRALSAHQAVDAAYSDDRSPGLHRSTMETAVRFTKDEAEAFSEELGEMLHRWSERNRGRDDGRITYQVHAMVLPHPDLAHERAATSDEDS
ncbi:MAG: ArsR family transcriptional regulator [Nocardioides sp.]|nr:ArsR family transcriptional regulator [Nocardioides sp.]